jgi:hypothetical protein
MFPTHTTGTGYAVSLKIPLSYNKCLILSVSQYGNSNVLLKKGSIENILCKNKKNESATVVGEGKDRKRGKKGAV